LPVMVTVTPLSGLSFSSYTKPKTIPSFAGLGDTAGDGLGSGGSVGVVDGLGVVVLEVYFTVIVSVPLFPAPSVAVTVMTLLPFDNVMLEVIQVVVPLTVPLVLLLLLLQLTVLTPLVLSDALPPRLIVLLVVV